MNDIKKSSKYSWNEMKLSYKKTIYAGLVLSICTPFSMVGASDIQIYSAPTAGKKTLVMMLDTSGSMGWGDGYGGSNTYSIQADYNVCVNDRNSIQSVWSSSVAPRYRRYYCAVSYSTNRNSAYQRLKNECEVQPNNGGLRCFDRLTRLKDGMFTFLNSTNPVLQDARVGLGNFSANGDGNTGQITVPALPLGNAGSTHRSNLKTTVASLTAFNGTPSAHAFTEAAAYLMGTSTQGSTNLQAYFQITNDSYYAVCNGWSSDGSCSGGWNGFYRGNVPNGYTRRESGRLGGYNGYYYYGADPSLLNVSGFGNSTDNTKNSSRTAYNSPLPAVADRVSCDGQGVYFLSDGEPNSTTDSKAQIIMKTALGSYGAGFSCSGLTNTSNDSGWACMGAFARKLYNKDTNPAGVSIQTAFVGFGRDFTDLSNSGDVRNACRLSSRTQNDRTSDDSCSPTSDSGYAIASPGYGNGGFFTTQTSAGITNSVVDFINNLGNAPVDPLATGAIAVPVDSFDPSRIVSTGYLRALEPNPGNPVMVWTGNLKKYAINNGILSDGSKSIFNEDGWLRKDTRDAWNAGGIDDQGAVRQGGVYSRLLMPTSSGAHRIRPLFTDVASVNNGNLVKMSSRNTSLLSVPARPVANNAAVLDAFNDQNVLKNFPIDIKVKLLNYLGYDLDLTTTTELPETLEAPSSPFISMGGSMHSLPVQLTYSGTLDEYGELEDSREQSILYGSMEGGLRLVNENTGQEQMVFVPADILTSPSAKALRRGEAGDFSYGMDGSWVSDAAYNIGETSIDARKMNIYGGMRMGGKSYYGLNVLNPTSPKLLFRAGADMSAFSRMGQTWSKPVIVNVRYGGVTKRVMIVGGGYDMCYENPRFRLNSINVTSDFLDTSCNGKTRAEGNAIYIIDAETGDRLWWASNTGADKNHSDLVHSVVSRISAVDRDADGFVDHLYFGDLGGQIFRVDLNSSRSATAASFGKRITRLAVLGTADERLLGDQPRFYQPVTVTYHTEGVNRFLVIGAASGDRSTPLDVAPVRGRDKILPLTALVGRPDNNVYGIIDRDFANKDLILGTISQLKSENITMSDLRKNPQTITGDVGTTYFPGTGAGLHGWYRSLSSDASGARVSGLTSGGVKAIEEEPVAIFGRLLIPVYDPESTQVTGGNPCAPRIIGETLIQQYCLPYGVCLTSNGTIDSTSNARTGYRTGSFVGAGMRSLSFAELDPGSGSCPEGADRCIKILCEGNNCPDDDTWPLKSSVNQIRWYEKNVHGSE